MEILVINLERRKDRWLRVSQEFGEHHHRLTRINAIDAADTKNIDIPNWPSRTAAACGLSHRQAWKEVESSGRRALILEDDAVLKPGVTIEFITKVASESTIKDEVDLLQVGFIESSAFIELLLVTHSRLRSTLYSPNKARYVRTSRHSPAIIKSDFRSGTHAYVLSPSGASKLLELGLPGFLPVDYALTAVSHNSLLWAEITIARLTRSLVNQASKEKRALAHDSDIA